MELNIISELLKNTSKSISVLTYPLNQKFNELKQLAEENQGRLKLFHSINTRFIPTIVINRERST